jgi:hypothetical protein
MSLRRTLFTIAILQGNQKEVPRIDLFHTSRGYKNFRLKSKQKQTAGDTLAQMRR